MQGFFPYFHLKTRPGYSGPWSQLLSLDLDSD